MKLEAKSLLAALNDQKVEYKLFEHEAFFTVEESSKLKSNLNMQGAHTKNLFLRDKRKNNILLVAHQDTIIDLKLLAKNLNLDRLSFGSPERLMENLGVLPGAVSPFSMINGVKKDVKLFLDNNLKSFKKIFAHPLENNQTVEISIDQLEFFFKKISATPSWISL